ncbi:MAG: AI-2E family transporter [Chloroflexota bacterium]
MTVISSPSSPRWSSITKLVVALTIIVIVGALLVRMHGILAPVLMAFVLSYLLYPLASWLNRRLRLSWGIAVNLIYLVIVISLLGLLTAGGVGLVQQIQSLINVVEININRLPGFIESLADLKFTLGPFALDLSNINWGQIGEQAVSYVQPALGQVGNVVGAIASGALSTLGWTAFILIVSYFVLLESGGLREHIFRVNVPGYTEDFRRLGKEVSRIWNAFLRGQMIIFFLTAIVYAMVLSILGVRYAVVLALITGFSNFLPYVGPAINWVVLGLVTFFQTSNYFNLPPLAYTAVVILLAVFIDQIFNNLVNPRIMAQALRVHPAFVLIAAILAANLLGVLGVIIAAPLLATLQLFGGYTLRKMLDQDPWQIPEQPETPPPGPGMLARLRDWWRARRQKPGGKKAETGPDQE